MNLRSANPSPFRTSGRPAGRTPRRTTALATGCALAAGLLIPGSTTAASGAAGPVTLTGTVRDASAHAWPLWAKVSVDGVPDATTYSTPSTGEFSVTVPDDGPHTLTVTPQYPGYGELTHEVESAGTAVDLAVPVNESTCIAPGYQHTTDGLIQAFESEQDPAGWTITEHVGNGQDWQFGNPGERANQTGGSGNFAIVDSKFWGYDYEYEGRQDTELISPVVDLRGIAEPSIGFNSHFATNQYSSPSQLGDVYLSVDGGETWENIWHRETHNPDPESVVIPVPQAIDQPDVRVKFHYHETEITASLWWQLDNIYIGNRRCDPIDGGLVTGQVTDANTGDPVTGASVVSGEARVTSAATPDDDDLGDGFYWMFTPSNGTQEFTVAKRQYHDLVQQVSVADGATTADFALPAGRLKITQETLAGTPRWARAATTPLTVSNTGTAPMTMRTAERPGDFAIASAHGEPWSDLGEPAADGWTSLADYPLSIRDNVADVHDGMLYSFGGVPTNSFGEPTDASYVYDPATDSWSPIAPMPRPRQQGAGAFVDGKFYYAAGTTGQYGIEFTTALDIYDPATDSWTSGADYPDTQADAGFAVLGKSLYVIGGCDTGRWCGSTGVYRYDTTADSWSSVADYPEPLSWMRCGAIEERIYCTGGSRDIDENSTASYAYDPASDTWSRRADLPIPMYKMASTVADGKLLISGGVHNKLSTARGFAYDPVTDSWSDLPPSINEVSRGGSACGFYKIGGTQSWSNGTPFVEKLPGYDDCASDRDSPWLGADRTVTVQPGDSVRLNVRLDAAEVDQPGSYTADLLLRDDTPYGPTEVGVTMTVESPRLYGKVLGTVTGVRCDGSSVPLGGSTVSIRAGDDRLTLRTDDNGRYARWLDIRDNPLQVFATADGWLVGSAESRIRPGGASVEDFTLHRADCG